MDGIAKGPRQSFRMPGRSYVALAFCPVVPIVGWLEEVDVTLARSPGFLPASQIYPLLTLANWPSLTSSHAWNNGTFASLVSRAWMPLASRRACRPC